MKKTDLLKLIEGIEDEGSVDEVLSQSDFAKSLLASGLTLDAFKGKENEPEFKSYLDSIKDTHFNKALETWKSNNLQTIINDEVLKATGKKKTPEELKYEQLEKQLNEEKAIRIKAENTNKLNGLLSEAGLDPKKAAEFFNIDNMENIEKAIGNFKAYMDEGIKAGVKEQISAGNYPPPGENGAGELTADDITKMMM